MRKHILILFFVFGFIALVNAQVPGYEGKRINLKFNLRGMPLVGNLLSDEKIYDCNPRFSLGLDGVISKRVVLGISVEQTNDIIYLKKYSVSSDFILNQFGDNDNLIEYKSAANFDGYSYGANLKLFSKSSGSLAPLGRFVIFEYLYNNINVSDDGRFYASGKKDLSRINSHTFQIGLGTQKVYLNWITLEGNVKIGFNTCGWGASRKQEERFMYDEVYRTASSKLMSDYLITAGVGIGILPF